MKRCPECRRDYFDDSLAYCLDDGSVLVDGPGGSNEPPTISQHDTNPIAEASTKIHFQTTDATAILPAGIVKQPRPWSRVAVGGFLVTFVAALVASAWFIYRASPAENGNSLNSIAVLPFENRSGTADSDYLADGLTDSLIFRFSQLPNLKVSPTSSVMRYKNASKDVVAIAKELDVDAVLSGRLMQVGDDLSISVQLIDTRTNKLVWAEKYDRKMADLLATQREIAITLTQKMQLKLAVDERGITKKYTSSNESYQLYMKGRFHWARRTKDDLLKAIESYKQAIDIDPNFALAYAALAEVYNSMGKNPDAKPKDCVPLAKAAATRALEIDPTLAEAHSAMADALAIYDWNWVESERHFKRALELDPNISYIHLAYGLSYLAPMGKAADSATEVGRAVELEPASLISNAVLTTAYIFDRRYDEALDQARKTYELDPNFPLTRYWLGSAYLAKGQYEEAVNVAQQMNPEAPLGWMSTVLLGHAYAKLGRRADAEQQIAKLREIAKTRYVRPSYIALIYGALGDKDKAFAELERAFEEHDCYLGRINSDPFMDPLRDDPRFADLLKRIGLS